MINEALIHSIVRNVLLRLRDEPREETTPVKSERVAPTRVSTPIEDLNQLYRARYLHTSPFEERFSVEFDSSLPVELGRPLVCLYEAHKPCDSCGRCEIRGF